MSELPSGRGTFLIKRVFTTDKDTGEPNKSKAGEPMVCLYIEVKDSQNRTGLVREYIIERDGLAFLDTKRLSMFTACNMAHLCVPGSNKNLDFLEGLDGECLIKLEKYKDDMQPKIDKYYPHRVKATDADAVLTVAGNSRYASAAITSEFDTFDESIPF